MAGWNDVVDSAPELAAAVRAFFDAHEHKTLATLRKDGSPRISAIEVDFIDGDVWLGSMWRSRKSRDLQRDPRFALHSGSEDPPAWTGEAKISGRADEIADQATIQAIQDASGGEAPPGPSNLFRADIAEVVLVRLGEPADHIVFELWRPGEDVRRIVRR